MDMKVEITNPKAEYKPGDTMEGIISLTNPDKDRKGIPKPAKMKFVQINFAEHMYVSDNEFGKWSVFLDSNHESFEGKMVGKEIELAEWKNVEFKDNNPISKPFSIKVPGGWHSNLGQKNPGNNDWFVIMTIREKTGLIGTPKFNRIIPVANSDRTADFMN
jgi:hypothetical protein